MRTGKKKKKPKTERRPQRNNEIRQKVTGQHKKE